MAVIVPLHLGFLQFSLRFTSEGLLWAVESVAQMVILASCFSRRCCVEFVKHRGPISVMCFRC